MAYSGMRPVTLAWKTMMSKDATTRQGDDAAGEHQAASAVGQLTGEVPVGRLERRQTREVRVGRVGGHDENRGRRRQ